MGSVRRGGRRRIKRLKNDSVYLLVLVVYYLPRVLPRPLGLRLFGFLGAVVSLIPTAERKVTEHNLEMILGGRDPSLRAARTARGVYREVGKNLYDAIVLSRADDATFHRLVRFDDLDDFRRAHARGKGVIVITAHLGCFELLLQFFARHGFPSFAIGRKLYDPRLDKLVRRGRSGRNIQYLHRNSNPRAMLRLLRRGYAFGVLIDQDTRTDGEFAPFLGKPAFTPSAPVKLAMRYDIPAFVVTTTRGPDNTHQVHVGSEVSIRREGDFGENLLHNLALVNERISAAILAAPRQWLWMHRRWRRAPAEGHPRERPAA